MAHWGENKWYQARALVRSGADSSPTRLGSAPHGLAYGASRSNVS
ncbi:hypothetical protein [Salinactinospora qingdaonensis]|uniref:Uncharacterized protein n=1 Tax=Salinactinospora qingdaonensis TaxID=702744 RepID=A0ABP7FN11_9ACTN